MPINPNIAILAIALLVMLSVGAIFYATFYQRITSEKRKEKRFSMVSSSATDRAEANSRKVDTAQRRRNVQATLKDIEVKQKHQASRGRNPPMSLRLQQAGLKWKMSHFIIFSVISAIVIGTVAKVLGAPLLAALGATFAGGFGFPRFVVNFLRKRRMNAFINELPNAVEVIVRGVKAGLPLNDCVRMIAIDANEPVRTEFRFAVETMQMGMTIDQAVGRLYERVPLPEVNFFAIVIAIQAKAGGNLSEALGNLARVLRERKKMRAKIQAMSMEAKASAVIIGAMPIIVAVLVYITSPDYISILWIDPIGQIIMGISGLWMLMGILVMRKMINFDI
ncbi:Flp pilus assembly protein TadB [Hartmannibacter diazotrophicus]|uniref:Flp pilus assembly protein TadB n=1 Tax=Hartmannibacter diazotrophicus TaxID=1482074 RepID=A0A2C9D3P2_9HYPH|nr:type II secretion system F family protein [Hartmannibacter diazotrophicus]SON54411.1 Flp pilus assembly protein TadB [Hartmannibacter diazotrophicus]